MKSSLSAKIFLILSIALLIAGLPGCAMLPQVSAVEGQDRENVLVYSEPLADNLFAAINNWDYEAFSKDFDPAMKKAMSETDFNEMVTFFQNSIGDYQSRTVEKVELVDNIYVVSYQAAFENEEAVSIRLSLRGNNPPQVAGLFFDSPKLREK